MPPRPTARARPPGLDCASLAWAIEDGPPQGLDCASLAMQGLDRASQAMHGLDRAKHGKATLIFLRTNSCGISPLTILARRSLGKTCY